MRLLQLQNWKALGESLESDIFGQFLGGVGGGSGEERRWWIYFIQNLLYLVLKSRTNVNLYRPISKAPEKVPA